MAEIDYLIGWLRVLRARRQLLAAEDGYTLETVLATFALAGAAIIVGTIITNKVIAKANAIDTGP